MSTSFILQDVSGTDDKLIASGMDLQSIINVANSMTSLAIRTAKDKPLFRIMRCDIDGNQPRFTVIRHQVEISANLQILPETVHDAA